MSNYKTMLCIIVLVFSSFSSLYAQTTYEVLLSNDFKEFKSITCPLRTIPREDRYKNVNKAYDIILNVLNNYPRTLTAGVMVALLNSSSILWDRDKIMINKYHELKTKYIGNLNDPNIDTAEKLLFMLIATKIEYTLNPNKEVFSDISIKCNEGLLKMKTECINNDYASLAHIALMHNDNEEINNEFIQKYPDHPYVIYAEQNLLTIKYLWINSPDYTKYIEEAEKFTEKYKKVIWPGGYSSEIGLYELYVGIYHLMNEPVKVKYYLKLLKENAPDSDILLNFETMYSK